MAFAFVVYRVDDDGDGEERMQEGGARVRRDVVVARKKSWSLFPNQPPQQSKTAVQPQLSNQNYRAAGQRLSH